jgi:uncharacterized protein YndB with AHSA1/START domain
MTMEATIPSVRRDVTVAVPVERAFAVFTERIGEWWPESHHIQDVQMETPVVEPRAGGRFYERGVDGSECDWGRVLVYEPPERLVLSWMITPEFQPDPDPSHASEVEVRFTPLGAGSTRVELEHRGFERHGAGGERLAASVAGEGGWGWILAGYGDLISRSGPGRPTP